MPEGLAATRIATARLILADHRPVPWWRHWLGLPCRCRECHLPWMCPVAKQALDILARYDPPFPDEPPNGEWYTGNETPTLGRAAAVLWRACRLGRQARRPE